MKNLRLGIIGTGRIAHRFVQECKEVPYVELVAVYNPHEGSAARFVRECSMTACTATADMTHFLVNVDAVYIAAPHETHYEYAMLALDSGKHVLCEKPMCLKGEQAAELYRAAEKNHLVLMEAIKTAYCPGFQGIMELVESGRIGTVHDVEACFSRLGNSSLREVWDLENGGSFTEFGTYSLLPVVKLHGVDNRDSFIWSLPARTGVDSYTKMTITYDHGIATAKTGLGVKSEGQLVIAGSNGYILVPSPWWLTRHVEVHYEDSNKVGCFDYPFEGSGLRYEITSFVKKVLALQEMLAKHKKDESGIISDIWKYIHQIEGVTPEESIWMACQMESFQKHRKKLTCELNVAASRKRNEKKVNIWAHRGCCMQYPENTLMAFEAAAKLEGLTGIELDVQLTKDGELVVIHDEKVDRTTTGSGQVKDFSLDELKSLRITGSGQQEAYVSSDGVNLTVPTLREVFDLLAPYCKSRGLFINIELKNSVIRYEGMEQKAVDLAAEYQLEPYIVYSSFLHESAAVIKTLNPSAQTGVLAVNIHDCMHGAVKYNADAVHPCILGLDINSDIHQNDFWAQTPVRAWNTDEPFYGQDRELREMDLTKYALFGVTDIITNVPERYL